ncbi:MAG TPA: hypothetical protein VGB00_15560 [Pyrinomonadaceae bacterium]|jgi:hypothetical protein
MKIFQIVSFLSLLNLVILAAGSAVTAQAQPQPIRPKRADESENRRWREPDVRWMSSPIAARQLQNAAQKRALKAKATPKDLEAVKIDEGDKIKFAEFLKQPRTGIFRLHDIDKCEENQKIYNVEEPCPSHIIDKGSAYSFLERDYDYRLLADIWLQKSSLRIRKIETLSFLTDLGDVPIENLTPAAEGIRQMAEFVPSADKKEVLAQHRIATRGFQVGKYVYKTSHPLKENSTYSLRAITYRLDNPGMSVKTKRLDVIVVFRVVRAHTDGSVSVLWKELQRKEAPKMLDKDVARLQPSQFQ